jgi:hypothetical protein
MLHSLGPMGRVFLHAVRLWALLVSKDQKLPTDHPPVSRMAVRHRYDQGRIRQASSWKAPANLVDIHHPHHPRISLRKHRPVLSRTFVYLPSKTEVLSAHRTPLDRHKTHLTRKASVDPSQQQALADHPSSIPQQLRRAQPTT